MAVFGLDLDRFKDVNDTLGHATGDALLEEVAARLKESVRETDLVGRLGGDEFAIVQFCDGCEPTAAPALASHIVEVIAAPYEIEGHPVVIGISVGIAIAPADGRKVAACTWGDHQLDVIRPAGA